MEDASTARWSWKMLCLVLRAFVSVFILPVLHGVIFRVNLSCPLPDPRASPNASSRCICSGASLRSRRTSDDGTWPSRGHAPGRAGHASGGIRWASRCDGHAADGGRVSRYAPSRHGSGYASSGAWRVRSPTRHASSTIRLGSFASEYLFGCSSWKWTVLWWNG